MRHLLLACLIALLPLRGWIGDAMALELTGQALRASTSDQTHAPMPGHHAPADDATAVHADCHGHAAAVNDRAEEAPHAGADCTTCTVCQICHGAALTPQAFLAEHEAQPAGRLSTLATIFSSAERAPGFKPPIS